MTASSKSENWCSVEFETNAEQEDLCSWLMIQLGAKGCQISPAQEGAVLVHASFEGQELSDAQKTKLKAALEEYGLSASLRSLRFQTIENQDWLAEWKKGFEPFAIGKSFLICPPWSVDSLTADQKQDKHLIVIEPGLAFGTGHHATTRYCLEAIERNDLGGLVVDVGTGSGILAMAAAKVNETVEILAVDNDPVSITVAAENLQINQLSHRVQLKEGSTELFDNLSVDTILSNLTCEDIVALLIDYLRILRPSGIIICAGILQEKLPKLQAAITDYPLSIVHQQFDDIWAGVTLQRIPVEVRAH